MKKRILPVASLLLFTASVFYFSGCKKAIENALAVECFKCVHSDPAVNPDQDDVCNGVGITTSTDVLEAAGYTCTKK